MKHDLIIITSNNLFVDKTSVWYQIANLANSPIKITKFWLNKQDYDDILQWGKK